MVKAVEIELGGQQFVLRRSMNNIMAIEKRFGTLDLGALFARDNATFSDKMEMLLGITAVLIGPSITAEMLGDLVDIGDIEMIIGKIGEVMGGSRTPADARSLAPFVPTPDALIERMLDVAELRQGEVFLDPCCGDGRTLVSAGKRGAVVRGCEIDKERYETCIERAHKGEMGAAWALSPNDGIDANFSVADVIFLYTLPESNKKLQPLLLAQCKDSARIVSHAFDMPGWPDYHSGTFEGKRLYAWRMSDVRAALAAKAA